MDGTHIPNQTFGADQGLGMPPGQSTILGVSTNSSPVAVTDDHTKDTEDKVLFKATADTHLVIISAAFLATLSAYIIVSQESHKLVPVYKAKLLYCVIFSIVSYLVLLVSPFFTTPRLTVIVQSASAPVVSDFELPHRHQGVPSKSEAKRDPQPSASAAGCDGATQVNGQRESTIQLPQASLPPCDNLPTSVPVQSIALHTALLTLSPQDAHLVELDGTSPISLGGSCDLFIGIHLPTMTKLAMKSPRFTTETEEATLRRAKREADRWREFNHPNILPFYGTLEKGLQFYLVSPFVPRGDLLTFLQIHYGTPCSGTLSLTGDPGLYPEFSELQATRDIAAGLGYLHSLGIIHGDLKGRNILLLDNGRMQICDFGLTKLWGIDVTSMERKGIGSPRWQSPELFNNEPKTKESDVYAFGMTIVEILTGNYPFPHLTIAAVLKAIVSDNERPPFDPLFRSGVDYQPLWNLAAKCWAALSVDRPTMDQVLSELQWPSG